VRSILKAAISSAEQIVESVRQRAEEEAKAEAARIIAEARRQAEGVDRGAAAGPDGIVEIIPAAKENKKEAVADEPVTGGSREKSLLEEAAEAEIKGALVSHSDEEAPVEEAASAEAQHSLQDVEATGEKKPEAGEDAPEVAPPEKTESPVMAEEAPLVEADEPEQETAGPVAVGEASQAVFTGEVEIVVGVPVDPNIVTKLYGYLQTTPQIKFVRTAGSWNKGTSISVVLEKKIPLIAELSSRIPEAMITGEPAESGKKDGSRVDITLKK
jgi:hypothetical protein